MKLKDKIECTLERHVKLKENQSENIEKIPRKKLKLWN